MIDGWMMLDRAGRWLFPHFVNALWMSSVFVLFICLVVRGGRVRAAVMQHALWRAALLGLCLSPLLACVGEAFGLPTLGHLARIHVRPAPAPASAPAVAGPAVRPEWEADQRAVASDGVAAIPFKAEGTAPLPGDETRSRPLALHALARTHGLALLAVLWWVGLTFTLARWGMHRVRLGRMNRATEPVGDPTLLAVVQRARERLGLRRPVAVRQSTDLSVPVVFGAWRPCLLLPSGWAGRANAETLEAVLLHELAHVARGDLWVNAWLQAAQCAFWFHPLVYLIGRELGRTAEAACDDWVIVETGQRARYANVLVALAEQMVSRPAGTLAGLPFARRGSNLKRRVQMILDEKRPLAACLSRRAKWGLGIVTILAGALALSTRAMGTAGEPPMVTEERDHDPVRVVRTYHLKAINLKIAKIDAAIRRGAVTDATTEQGRFDLSAALPFTIRLDDQSVPWPSLAETALIQGDIVCVDTSDGRTVVKQGRMVYPLALINGHPFVPVRSFARLLGREVGYYGQDAIVRGPNPPRFFVNSDRAWNNVTGLTEKVKLPAPTYLEQNHLMVPLQFLVEALGHTYHYDLEAHLVTITTRVRTPLSGLPCQDPRAVRLGFGSMAAWSPDGRWLVYLPEPPTSLYLKSPEQGEEELGRAIPSTEDAATWGTLTLAWSPEGRRLLAPMYSKVERIENGFHRSDARLYVVDVETGQRRLLTQRKELALDQAEWSPDGRKIAFVAEKRGVPLVPVQVQRAPDYKDETVMRPPKALWVAEADGSAETQLTHTPGCDERWPTWSPDGTALAFERYQRGEETLNIWTVRADGTGLKQLTDYGICMCPAWSPDGDSIAYYQRNRDAHSVKDGELWLVHPDNGARQRIVASAPHPVDWHNRPVWDREGQRIFFVSEGELFVVNVEGGEPTQLTQGANLQDPHTGGSIPFSLSPDGTQLVFSQSDRGNMQAEAMLILPLE